MKFLFPKSTYYIYESFTVLFGSLYSFYQFNTNKNFKVIEQKKVQSSPEKNMYNIQEPE